jgi:V/A-type H+-transporting ATPase subunit I
VIVTMAKVELAGPKVLLEDVLGLLRDTGAFQIDPESIRSVEHAEHCTPLPEGSGVAERLYLDEIRERIEDLLACLPAVPVRESYLEPRGILDTVSETLKRHTEQCLKAARRREELRKELEELEHFRAFFGALGSLFAGVRDTPDLDFIGVRMKFAGAVEPMREMLGRLTEGRFEFLTETVADGTVVGLLAVQSADSLLVREELGKESVPEFRFDGEFDSLAFPEKVARLAQRVGRLTEELDTLGRELGSLAARWGPIYARVREWLDERISMLGVSASACQTRMCFFVMGWMPEAEVAPLRQKLAKRFAGQVAIEQRDILVEDLERVPVALRNPPYFKPFELFTRILPLPRYTSYDPTTFVGIFFPVFFGMILGDAGYALVLALAAAVLLRLARGRERVRDGARIALVCAAYSLVFGILYGEFFGELGASALGLHPIWMERRTAVFPMLMFALAVGIFHVVLGLFLGFLSSARMRAGKQAAFRLLGIAFLVVAAVLAASLLGFLPRAVIRPMSMALIALVPLVMLAGGFLAPLELLKNVGNIISYARIMAIGLTSVLLAHVANRLGGLAGDVVLGALVGGLLHLLNIILGVFSPTIHSIRLHYVEFFGKFLEHGGRRFKPLTPKT